MPLCIFILEAIFTSAVNKQVEVNIAGKNEAVLAVKQFLDELLDR